MLPGPGRFLSHRVPSPDGTPDALAGKIKRRGGLYVYPISATATLGNEGEKSVFPYVQAF